MFAQKSMVIYAFLLVSPFRRQLAAESLSAPPLARFSSECFSRRDAVLFVPYAGGGRRFSAHLQSHADSAPTWKGEVWAAQDDCTVALYVPILFTGSTESWNVRSKCVVLAVSTCM